VVRWFLASPIGMSILQHGWMTGSSLEFWAGIVVSAAPLIWSMFVHTQDNAVRVVDAIAKQPDSPVRVIITETTVAGKALAEDMPGKTTVVAGTVAAISLAKAV
jgi:hypothetical protein